MIVPVFNKRGTLPRTIQSIVAQQGIPAEIVVVDDGSTDGSLDSLQPAATLRCLWQPNSGVAAARNLGIAAATGEYIAFLDADDYWLPGFLEQTIAFLEEHPECGAVSTAFYTYDGNCTALVPAPGGNDGETLRTAVIADFFGTYARLQHVWTGAVLARRSLIDKAGPMRADLPVAEDIEYWLRIGTMATWGFVDQPLAVYDRTDPTSLTRISAPRGLLPDIELWQRDIVPRLQPEHMPGFLEFRRSMARTMTLNLLTRGRPDEARKAAQFAFAGSSDWLGRILWRLRPAPVIVWRLTGWAMTAALVARIALRRLLDRERGAGPSDGPSAFGGPVPPRIGPEA
ncbi:MAG: hypothetical protein A2W26_08645, partial [Acidobacteria bacterium RBG_16_64_8]